MNILVVQRQSLVARVDFSLSVYARVIEAMDWLQDHCGVKYAVCGEASPHLFSMLRWADAVIFSKHFSPQAQKIAAAARVHGCVTLLDIDDWIFAFPAYSGGVQKGTAHLENIRAMLDAVDHVTVPNEFLHEKVAKIRPDVVLMPNGIYVERYPKPCMMESSLPRIVFTNADSLKIQTFRHEFLQALNDFSSNYPEVIFDYFGDASPELLDLELMFFSNRIPYNDFIHCLSKGGYIMAVTPLGGEEDPDSYFFNRCKNPFKYLNYGVAGIPCIYSNVKIYRDCVRHGETGILVENTYAAWTEALESLYSDRLARLAIRENAYRNVCEHHHIRQAAELLLKILGSPSAD